MGVLLVILAGILLLVIPINRRSASRGSDPGHGAFFHTDTFHSHDDSGSMISLDSTSDGPGDCGGDFGGDFGGDCGGGGIDV